VHFILISIIHRTIAKMKHRYIEETLEQDHAMFKPILNVNSFLTNFMTEGIRGGDDNEQLIQLGLCKGFWSLFNHVSFK